MIEIDTTCSKTAGTNESLLRRHDGHNSISNHQPHNCLLKSLCRRSSKKTSKLHVTGLWVGNPPVTGELPAQRTSNAANVSIWLCPHVTSQSLTCGTKLRDELQYLKLIWKMFLQTMFVIHTANTLDTILHQYCQHYIFHVKYILYQNPLLFMGLPSIPQFL